MIKHVNLCSLQYRDCVYQQPTSISYIFPLHSSVGVRNLVELNLSSGLTQAKLELALTLTFRRFWNEILVHLALTYLTHMKNTFCCFNFKLVSLNEPFHKVIKSCLPNYVEKTMRNVIKL